MFFHDCWFSSIENEPIYVSQIQWKQHPKWCKMYIFWFLHSLVYLFTHLNIFNTLYTVISYNLKIFNTRNLLVQHGMASLLPDPRSSRSTPFVPWASPGLRGACCMAPLGVARRSCWSGWRRRRGTGTAVLGWCGSPWIGRTLHSIVWVWLGVRWCHIIPHVLLYRIAFSISYAITIFTVMPYHVLIISISCVLIFFVAAHCPCLLEFSMLRLMKAVICKMFDDIFL